MMGKFRFYFFLLLVSFSCLAAAEFDPLAVYLTWQRNPESTMTVCWVTNLDSSTDLVEYQRKGETAWKSITGQHVPMPDKYSFWIHSVELTQLQPDTEYIFRISAEGVKYKFRTMSNDPTKPIRFIVGGDVYHDGLDVLEKMNRQAAKLDPLFAIVGGDIAYNDHKPSALPNIMPRWMDWLIAWKNQMVAPDGRLIPLIPAIGNHDVKKRQNNKIPSDAPFFYALFPFPGPRGYNVLDFGAFMSLIILDSDHTNPVKGKQTFWLHKILEERKQIPHKFAVYHVGAYPSVRPFKDKTNSEIRKNWVPLFEQFGVSTAFEHHDHAYKRTWPLREGKIDFKDGILYIGDGAWGVETPRIPHTPEKVWYLAKTQSSRHVILTKIHDNERHFLAIDDKGEVIDETVSKATIK
jgi:acid phosphatase type 7